MARCPDCGHGFGVDLWVTAVTLRSVARWTNIRFTVGGIGTAIAIHFVPHFDEFQKFQTVVIIWRVSAAICDLSITFALLWRLVSVIL